MYPKLGAIGQPLVPSAVDKGNHAKSLTHAKCQAQGVRPQMQWNAKPGVYEVRDRRRTNQRDTERGTKSRAPRKLGFRSDLWGQTLRMTVKASGSAA